MSGIRVFISYSHDSQEHNERVLGLSERLRSDGIDAYLDQYVDSPPEGWMLWTKQQVSQSDFVLVICTKEYARQVNSNAYGKGLGVNWEETVVSQDLHRSTGPVNKIIPVLFSHNDAPSIPTFLKGLTYYELTSEAGYEQLYRRITSQSVVMAPELGRRIIKEIGSYKLLISPSAEGAIRGATATASSEHDPRSAISATQAFDRIGASVRQNLDEMKHNFEQARTQSAEFFRLTVLAAGLGFIIVLVGVVLLLIGQVTAGVLTSIGGIIPEITAALFFKKDSELRATIRSYHEYTLESQQTLSMIDVCETIVDPQERIE